MSFKRHIEPAILDNLDHKRAIVVTGMRRVGKTTLLKRVFERIDSSNKAWFDFENPLDIKQFQDVDYNDIYQNLIAKGLSGSKRMYVFIDEVQHYPEISKVIKYLIDHYEVKFIVTGSASYYLKNLFPESLAGRKIIFELYPLTLREFLVFKSARIEQYDKDTVKERVNLTDYERYDGYYREFLQWGGFPEVVLEEDWKKKRDILEDIFASYFQNEVVNLADYRKNDKIRDLILLLSARVGSKLDITRIAQELGIARKTVYSYLSFLEATYFIAFVSKLSSVDRSVSGADKLYWCDNGILRIMGDIAEGHLLENAVFNQLRHRGSLSYYQTRSGNEIDFIIGEKVGYEVKQTATKSDIKNAKRIAEKLGLEKVSVASKSFVEDAPPEVVYAQFL